MAAIIFAVGRMENTSGEPASEGGPYQGRNRGGARPPMAVAQDDEGGGAEMQKISLPDGREV